MRLPSDVIDRLQAGQPCDQCVGRLPVSDLRRQRVAGGDVGRVGHDHVDRSCQRAVAAARTRNPRSVVSVASVRLTPARLHSVTATASADESTHHTSTAWRSAAMDSPTAPLPHPRSITFTRRRRFDAWRSRVRRSSSASAASTTCSVSGRGISTRRSTSRSRVRKPQRPSTYCNGSPVRRRATSSANRAASAS